MRRFCFRNLKVLRLYWLGKYLISNPWSFEFCHDRQEQRVDSLFADGRLDQLVELEPILQNCLPQMMTSGQSYPYDCNLRLYSRTWLENTPYYDPRVVIYNRRGFIGLATDVTVQICLHEICICWYIFPLLTVLESWRTVGTFCTR